MRNHFEVTCPLPPQQPRPVNAAVSQHLLHECGQLKRQDRTSGRARSKSQVLPPLETFAFAGNCKQGNNIQRHLPSAALPAVMKQHSRPPSKQHTTERVCKAQLEVRERTCNIDSETQVPEDLFAAMLKLGVEANRRSQHVSAPRSMSLGLRLMQRDLVHKFQTS